MSNVYSLEPRTTGKVDLHTTYGLLSIELWGKECPLASRNFIQLCLEGYYDQSTFHRLIPGFCLQGGKPAKFEEGGEDGASIYENGRFSLEIHSRLKFSRRGLLGMVSLDPSNVKSTNGSQFFFTLSDAPELNGNATLFGRIVGDTIFNLLRMSELETDPKTEAPLYAPVILKTEVVLNPFDDIIPRELHFKSLEKGSEIIEGTTKTTLKKKNMSLLSFADEKDTDAVEEKSFTKPATTTKDFPITTTTTATISSAPVHVTASSSSSSIKAASSLQFLQQMKAAQMRETQDKIKLAEEELGFRAKAAPEIKSSAQQPQKEKDSSMTALERYKANFSSNRRLQNTLESKNEMDTLLLLNSFRQKIKKTDEQQPEIAEPAISEQPKHLDICKLHGLLNCLSCRDTFNIKLDTSELDEKDWMMHKLVFDRREIDGKVRADLKDLLVIDPREQASELKSKSKNNK